MPALGTTPGESAESAGDTDPPPPTHHGPCPPQEITKLRSDLDLSKAKCMLYRQLLQQLGPSFAYSLPMHPVHTRRDRVASLPPCRLYGAAIPRAPPLGPGRALTLPCGWNNAGHRCYYAALSMEIQRVIRESKAKPNLGQSDVFAEQMRALLLREPLVRFVPSAAVSPGPTSHWQSSGDTAIQSQDSACPCAGRDLRLYRHSAARQAFPGHPSDLLHCMRHAGLHHPRRPPTLS